MAYIDHLLGRGEQILFVARQHLFVLIANILTELALIALLVAAGVASHMAFDTTTLTFGGITASNLILLICVGISVAVLFSSFLDFLRWNSEQHVVTDRRLLHVQGVLSKQVHDVALEKINDVTLHQGLTGRLLNFGTVTVLTAAGDPGAAVLDRIEDPLAFQRALLDAKHQLEQNYRFLDQPYRMAPVEDAPVEVQRRLEELVALRDRGILSIDEFESRKRELLGQR
ncbi:MAG: PH domain-containing protein [Chloroflexaceae bacterium]